MMIKKVYKSAFFGLLIALNLGIVFILTVHTVNAQNNCTSQPSQNQVQQRETVVDKKQQEENERMYKQRQEEYKAMMLAQITNAKSEFGKLIESNFGKNGESTLNEFKECFAKSEATRAVSKPTVLLTQKLSKQSDSIKVTVETLKVKMDSNDRLIA